MKAAGRSLSGLHTPTLLCACVCTCVCLFSVVSSGVRGVGGGGVDGCGGGWGAGHQGRDVAGLVSYEVGGCDGGVAAGWGGATGPGEAVGRPATRQPQSYVAAGTDGDGLFRCGKAAVAAPHRRHCDWSCCGRSLGGLS